MVLGERVAPHGDGGGPVDDVVDEAVSEGCLRGGPAVAVGVLSICSTH
jgi:hypothetical protein